MKLIDISHTFSEATPPYPGDMPPRLIKTRSMEADSFVEYSVRSGLHVGTHIDMPMHLVPDGRFAADFDAGIFAGRGVLLNVRGETEIGVRPEYAARIHEGDIVLLYTGWDGRFGGDAYFLEHPVVTVELCGLLVSQKVKILGMDMPSPDRMPFSVHKTLLGAGIFTLENLTNLDAVPGDAEFEVFALPIRIMAEASPVRAVCVIRDGEEK